jgi:diguanylate cyclase (GGDEF)-like protein
MRSLSQRATVALVCLCVFFALAVAGVGVVGIVGVRSATDTGKSIAGDEVVTFAATAQIARSMDAAYAVGEEALLTGDPARRSQLARQLNTQLVPVVDGELSILQQLHAHDPAAELRNLALFARRWAAVRGLMVSILVVSGPQPGLATSLQTAYQPVSDQLAGLLTKEEGGAQDGASQADSKGAVTVWLIVATIVVGQVAAAGLALAGSRRMRRAVEPQQDRIEFTEALQIANDEQEAHQLLRRHLERSFPGTAAAVLSRNNSADRLEAVTPLPEGSPLLSSLSNAEPRSCLAVRSGRTHHQSERDPGLIACPVCAGCSGHSTCTALTVGGEVIGSVLLNRPAPYNRVEDQRIQESVDQAAPVLANLRNLAIAEIRAATDSLTGLPNQRAVTDTLKRMFAQATRTGGPLSLVVLDLDHFKAINDRLGHPVGDQALANVGAVLRSVLRVGDFAGRNGGEEFALLFPATEVAAAQAIAERVRAGVADITIPGVDLSLTASLGIAGYPDHAGDVDKLERLADAALYLAKRSGRDRTEIATSIIEPVTASELVSSNGRRPVEVQPGG